MKFYKLVLSIFLLNIFQEVALQSANCKYENFNHNFVSGYTCKLSSNSENIITEVIGQHDNNNSDDDVVGISNDSKFKIFPSIVCEKFKNLKWIWLTGAEIEIVDENSLKNCVNLEWLSISSNKIKNLTENVFASQSKLKKLYLDENQLEELPKNLFAPLVNLETISMSYNKIRSLHSSSFGNNSKLWSMHFFHNNLNSFDERIIFNKTILRAISGRGNPCVDGDNQVFDNTKSKDEFRNALNRCFDNYKHEPLLELTHRLKDENSALKSEINELKEEMKKIDVSSMKNQIAEIARKFENQNNEHKLENQELKTTIKALIESNDELKAENEKNQANIKAMSDVIEDYSEKIQADKNETSHKIAQLVGGYEYVNDQVSELRKCKCN